MAFGRTFVLCSRFVGVLVTEGGKPAPGIKMVRSWNWGWNDRSGRDETVTGPDGRFEFAAVTGKSLTASIAPHEPSVRQEIIAHGARGAVTIWSVNKKNYDMDGELDGRAINVVCRVDREPSAQGLIWGTCVESK